MRLRLSAIACVLLGVIACDTSSVQSPGALVFKPVQASVCPQDHECVGATEFGSGMTPDFAQLEMNCGDEACEPGPDIGTLTGVDVDASGDHDRINFNCSPGKGPGFILSDQTCWDCGLNCGGSGPVPGCPEGKNCVSVTIPDSPGSDCRKFYCDAGWQPFTTSTWGAPPQCSRPVSPPSSPPSTPTNVTASIVNGNPYLTWDAVWGATSYRIYRKLEWQSEFELWGSTSWPAAYTDSYAPVNSVLSWPSGNYLTYYVVAVNSAGSSGASEYKYYSYTPPIPY